MQFLELILVVAAVDAVGYIVQALMQHFVVLLHLNFVKVAM